MSDETQTTGDACPVCEAEYVPGVEACVNCGEPRSAPPTVNFTLSYIGPPPQSAEQIAEWKRDREEQQAYAELLTQARALEYADDPTDALVIYEELILDSKPRTSIPFHRLAIIYRRLKRPGDEERVVRAALAVDNPNYSRSWFVVRLAKIEAEQRKRSAPKSARRPRRKPPEVQQVAAVPAPVKQFTVIGPDGTLPQPQNGEELLTATLQFEPIVLSLLREERFADAVTVARRFQFESSGDGESRGIWQQWDPTPEVVQITAIYSEPPIIFLGIRPKALIAFQDIAAQMVAWNMETRFPEHWLPLPIETGIPLDDMTCIRQLRLFGLNVFMLHILRNAENPPREIGVKTSEDCCDRCRDLAGRRWLLQKAPELPWPRCRSQRGCHCGYEIIR